MYRVCIHPLLFSLNTINHHRASFSLTYIPWVLSINAQPAYTGAAAPGFLDPNHLDTLHFRAEAKGIWRRGGGIVKFHSTAYDPNNYMSSIPWGAVWGVCWGLWGSWNKFKTVCLFG